MKKFLILFIAVFVLCSCSNNTDETVIIKTSENVTTEDIMGNWNVISSYSHSLNNAKFIFDNVATCSWADGHGNFFEGPYYFIENINDETLKQQGILLDLQNLNYIHVETVKVKKSSNINKELLLICDLQTCLPHPDYLKMHPENIDKNTYYFWDDNYFEYWFEIINYNDINMELKLEYQNVRFGDYKNDYPLRLQENEIIKLERINK